MKEKELKYIIREIRQEEIGALEDLLYEAIFQPDESKLLPREVIKQPDISVYIDEFGEKEDDLCLVAEVEGKIIGAVWTRILDGQIKGYGNIDSKTPEFAIALFKGYRKQGIGTELMRQMLVKLRKKGYLKASLSVDRANYARRMYEKVGFKSIKEQAHDCLMLCDLKAIDM